MAKSIKKDVAKLNKVIHPRSRKAQKLNQKACRLETSQKSKKFHMMKENLVGEKLTWFQERLLPNVKVYTKQMFTELIEEYLKRFDEEMESIAVQHSFAHRQRRYASREDILNMTIQHDKEEFETCGLEVPDLLNAQQLAFLRNWNRELRFLQNFKLRRYNRAQLGQGKKTKASSKETEKSENRDESIGTKDCQSVECNDVAQVNNDETKDNVNDSPSSISVDKKKEGTVEDVEMDVDAE